MGNAATSPNGGTYRSAALAAMMAQESVHAPAAAAKKPAAPADTAKGRAPVHKDTSSTPASGKAPSAVLIYDIDTRKKRAPNAQEMASIQASPETKGKNRFVKSTENGAPLLEIATDKDFQEIDTAIVAAVKQEADERKDRRTERRVQIGVTTGIGLATYGGMAYKAIKVARVATTGTILVKGAQTLSVAGKAASFGGKALAFTGSKVLPVVGIVFGGIGIAGDVMKWKDPNNKKHGDDIARIGGNALSMIGSGMMLAGGAASLTGVGAIAGVPLAVAGLVVSGVGMLVSGIGSWFDDND
ncbi:MAG: hypothetical protein H7338_17085 [Candidatus Sericytochromatia bacterium]|nr:hypothetical protein [Candidatus Sericytochromatia bacterium]